MLNDGKRLEGTLLKQNDTTLWLDIGPMVIQLDNNDVKDIERAGDGDEVKVVRERCTTRSRSLVSWSPSCRPSGCL